METVRSYINNNYHGTLLLIVIGILLVLTWVSHIIWEILRYLGYGTILYLFGNYGYKYKDRLIFEVTTFIRYMSLHITYSDILTVGLSIVAFSLLFLMFKYYKKNSNIVDRFLNDRYGDIIDNKQLLISCLVKDLMRAEDELKLLKKLD